VGPVVVVVDVGGDHLPGLVERFELVAPDAALLEVAKPGLDERLALGVAVAAAAVADTDSDGFIGPWALHLTAHSNVLGNYGGGPGRVAIHGRSGQSLLDPLGSARSHGCVRVNNSAVIWLARNAQPGTPVLVQR